MNSPNLQKTTTEEKQEQQKRLEGRVKVSGTFHFHFADGSVKDVPFRSVSNKEKQP